MANTFQNRKYHIPKLLYQTILLLVCPNISPKFFKKIKYDRFCKQITVILWTLPFQVDSFP